VHGGAPPLYARRRPARGNGVRQRAAPRGHAGRSRGDRRSAGEVRGVTVNRTWRRALVALLLMVACAPAAPPGRAEAPARPTEAAAAGPAERAATRPAAAQAPKPTAPLPALEPNAAEWERLKAAGKHEGTVVVAGPGIPGFRQGITEGLQQAHGITVEYLGLRSGEVLTRVDQEARLGKPSLDVNIGGPTVCWVMAERGQVDDVTKLLVAPDVVSPSLWRGGTLRLVQPSPPMPQDFYCGLQTAEWVMTDLFV